MRYLLRTLFILFIISGCKVHEIKIENYMDTFDVKTYHENQVNNDYYFTLEDGSEVRQSEWENEFDEYITVKDSYFELYKSYYKSGVLKMLVERFPNSFVNYIKEYDEAGNLISETDYRNDFKYTWKDLLRVLKRRRIEILHRHTTIRKTGGNWHVVYVKKGFIHHAIFDSDTGKILQDAKNVFREGS